MTDITSLFVSPGASIHDVIARIDRNDTGIALVVDGERRLIGTITDGDIRRALLEGLPLDAAAREVLARKPAHAPQQPTTAPAGTSRADLLDLMNQNQVRQVPLVDPQGRVVDIVLLPDLVEEYQLPLRALVMAGGFGTRLRPLTDDRPKSMLPVGGRPLLEVIVRQLRDAGIRRVNLATHYKSEMIAQHFGDGRELSVEINYVREDQPLGTAGALSLLADSDEPLLVINGDILTQVNVAAMLEFHRANHADMTVAVRPLELQVPYGVVHTEGVSITRIDEKPLVRYLVNAGIYLINGDVCRLVLSGDRCDMTDLIGRAMSSGRRVISFPLHEYWLDIGKAEDYARAVSDAQEGKV
jgi:dTDP-glucose pyrophosphorylase/CBS domain-containing protein